VGTRWISYKTKCRQSELDFRLEPDALSLIYRYKWRVFTYKSSPTRALTALLVVSLRQRTHLHLAPSPFLTLGVVYTRLLGSQTSHSLNTDSSTTSQHQLGIATLPP
jgi:hypothetical protein